MHWKKWNGGGRMARSVRAAGMVLGGVSGLSPDDSDRGAVELLASYAHAGIRAYLFPGFLLGEPERLASLADIARSSSEEAGLGRAFLAIGGSGDPSFGLPQFPQAPTPLGLASNKSQRAAERAGFLIGSCIAACGIDMVLAPCLDLASDPKDPIGVLGGFGEDSRLAGLLGTAYTRGLFHAGVLACVGRFPGLGSVCRDCFNGMAFVSLPVDRLERCEMRPFARVVSSGVAAVLVGRALVPALESERIPASASARVIEGRLRESLGFRGLVIGDNIGPGEEPGKAAVLGALAGCDLVLYSRPDEALSAVVGLEKAAVTGDLPAVRIEVGRRRLDSILSRRPNIKPRPKALPMRRLIKAAGHDIEDGVSLLRGSLILDGAKAENFVSAFILVFVPPAGAPDISESDAVISSLRTELPGAEILGLPADTGQQATEMLATLVAPRGRYHEAVVLTYDAHFRPAQEGLARLVEEFIPKYRIIAMRDPYDAAFFPSAIGLGAAYGFSRACARAVGRLLSGKAKARGGRPVEVIGLEI
jgi:beta-N-acetylhexosaminidase